MLKHGAASVETCEHVLSAVGALGIDNLRIEVWGPEMPMADGSALPFFVALEIAGIRQQEGERGPPAPSRSRSPSGTIPGST